MVSLFIPQVIEHASKEVRLCTSSRQTAELWGLETTRSPRDPLTLTLPDTRRRREPTRENLNPGSPGQNGEAAHYISAQSSHPTTESGVLPNPAHQSTAPAPKNTTAGCASAWACSATGTHKAGGPTTRPTPNATNASPAAGPGSQTSRP